MTPTNTCTLVVPKTTSDGRTVMVSHFEWDGAREQAACDIAEGIYRKAEIADRAGVATATVTAWLKHPEFVGKVDELCAEMRERVRHLGLARVEVRVEAAHDRWTALRQIIKERAANEYDVAGGSTGMLAHDQKMIGGGENAMVVNEYKVDVGLLKEIRELELLAAKELGQHHQKIEIFGKDGGAIQTQAVELASLMSPDELETLKRRLQERAAAGTVVVEVVPEIAQAVESAVEPEPEMIVEEFPS